MKEKLKYLLTFAFVVLTFIIIDKKYKEKGLKNSNPKTGEQTGKSDSKQSEGVEVENNQADSKNTQSNSGDSSNSIEGPKVGQISEPHEGRESEVKSNQDMKSQTENIATTSATSQDKTGQASTAKTTSSAQSESSSKQSSGEQAPSNKTQPEPVKTPEKKVFSASAGEGSCEDQWKKYSGDFKVGGELVYMTNLAVQKPLAPDINTQHLETIKSSTSSVVARDLMFVSDHPTGVLVLSNLELSSQLKFSKQSFLNFCHSTDGRALGLALFNLSSISVVDITDANIEVGAGSFSAFKFKLDAQIQVGKKSTKAAAIVWVSRKKPGLVLKQTVRLTSKVFPDHGSITFSSQLAGTKNI